MDMRDMFEHLAEYGTAPVDGCSLFGVGYESAFERLERKYILDRLGRGGSAEKFVIGPFGSGKTHFLRQLMEIGRRDECVTVEVAMNKNLDYTKGLVVYQEIARQIRAPGQEKRGLRDLVVGALRRMRESAEHAGLPADDLVNAWIAGLTEQDFPLPAFGRVLQRTLQQEREGDHDAFEAGMRWLAGEVTDRTLAKQVGERTLSSSELQIHAHNAKLSLFRFVRHAGLRGTIVAFDEAEQGMATDKKKMAQIFSHLLSELNSLVAERSAAALIVYAVTPDVMEKLDIEMPMMRQRLADPAPGQGFFDGNVLAPRIDLTRRGNAIEELTRIGEALTALFFDQVPDADATRRDEAMTALPKVAAEVEQREASSSGRREMVKAVSHALVSAYGTTNGASTIGARRAMEAEV